MGNKGITRWIVGAFIGALLFFWLGSCTAKAVDARSVNWRSHIGTVAELIRLDPANYQTNILVLGYYTPGDGGGGLFYGDPASTATVDNGQYFSSTGGAGRFIRRMAGPVDPYWFGAMNDGVTDYTANLQRMVYAAERGTPIIAFNPQTTNRWIVTNVRQTNGIALTWIGNGARIGHKFDLSMCLTVLSGPLLGYGGALGLTNGTPSAFTNQHCFTVKDVATNTSFDNFHFSSFNTFANGDYTASGGNIFIAMGLASHSRVTRCTFDANDHQAISCFGDYCEISDNRFYDCGVNFGFGITNWINYGGLYQSSDAPVKSTVAPKVLRNFWGVRNGGGYKKPLLMSSSPGFIVRDNVFDVGLSLVTNSCVNLYCGDLGITGTNFADYITDLRGVFENNTIRGDCNTGLEVRNYFDEGVPATQYAPNTNQITALTAHMIVKNNRITAGRYAAVQVFDSKQLRLEGNQIETTCNPLMMWGDCSYSYVGYNDIIHLDNAGSTTNVQGAIIWLGGSPSGNLTPSRGLVFEHNRIRGNTNDEWLFRNATAYGGNQVDFTFGPKNTVFFNGLNDDDLYPVTPRLFTLQNCSNYVSIIDNDFYLTNGMGNREIFDISGTGCKAYFKNNRIHGRVAFTNIIPNQYIKGIEAITTGPVIQLPTNGFRFTLGTAITVTNISRWNILGNSQTHTLYIANSAGVCLASNTVTCNALQDGGWLDATINAPIGPGTYYCFSTEGVGGGTPDFIYDDNIPTWPSSYLTDVRPAYRNGAPSTTTTGGIYVSTSRTRQWNTLTFGFSGTRTNIYDTNMPLGTAFFYDLDLADVTGNTLGSLVISDTIAGMVSGNNLTADTNVSLIKLVAMGKATVVNNVLSNGLASAIYPLIYSTNVTNITVTGNMLSYLDNVPPAVLYGPTAAHGSWLGNETANPFGDLTPSVVGGMTVGQQVFNTSGTTKLSGDYTPITTSFALVTSGGTDLSVSLPAAGTYRLCATMCVYGSGAAYNYQLKLYDATAAADFSGLSPQSYVVGGSSRVQIICDELVTVTVPTTVKVKMQNDSANAGTAEGLRSKLNYVRLN